MDKKLYGGDHNPNLDFADLETRLAEVLVPVMPRNDFISDLKKRLLADEEISLLIKQHNPIQAILLGFAGVISGAVILLISIRALITLLGRKEYFQLKGQIQQKKSQTVGSAT